MKTSKIIKDIVLRLRRGKVLLCLPFLMIQLSGCASVPFPDSQGLLKEGVPSHHEISSVPVIEQEESYCGPAALATIAQYNKLNLSQQDAAKMVYTPGRKGTFQHDIVTAIYRLGLLAIPVKTSEDLVKEVSQDNPVIIFQNRGLSWYPVWHYSVVTGYDLSEKEFLIQGGTKKALWKPASTILSTWQRAGSWGYMAASPGEIPKTATEAELLETTASLEKAGFLDQAARSYRAIRKKYPGSYNALFGLANIEMAREDYVAAEGYYRQLLEIKPSHLYALNNLAYSLKGQEGTDEACQLLSKQRAGQDTVTQDLLKDSYNEICKEQP